MRRKTAKIVISLGFCFLICKVGEMGTTGFTFRMGTEEDAELAPPHPANTGSTATLGTTSSENPGNPAERCLLGDAGSP